VLAIVAPGQGAQELDGTAIDRGNVVDHRLVVFNCEKVRDDFQQSLRKERPVSGWVFLDTLVQVSPKRFVFLDRRRIEDAITGFADLDCPGRSVPATSKPAVC
jgi:hypothetical protein